MKNIVDNPAVAFLTRWINKFIKFWSVHSLTILSISTILFYMIGCFAYSRFENWTIITCIYFITISCTTVGFGDYYPTSDFGRCFTIFYVFIGTIALFSTMFKMISESIEKTRKNFSAFADEHIDVCFPNLSYIYI